jgi:hypothetical protein
MPHLRDDVILVDFYESADGPTILIDTQSLKALRRVMEAFARAAEGIDGIDLARLDWVFRGAAIERLILSVIQAGDDQRRGLILSQTAAGAHFTWLKTPVGWNDSLYLLDGLVDAKGPGHQYLTDGPPDDAAIVVVQFKE